MAEVAAMIHYCLPGNDYSSALIDGPVPRVGDEVRFRDMRNPELLTDPPLPDSTFRVSQVSHYIVIRTGIANSDGCVYVYLEDVP